MKYLLLIYQNEQVWQGRSPEESARIFNEYMDYTRTIHRNGNYIAGEALQPVATATTVRQRNGKTLTTDGPFAETKDLIAGWMVIDVETYERALELAAELSAAPGAGGKPIHEWLEVRPLLAPPLTITE